METRQPGAPLARRLLLLAPMKRVAPLHPLAFAVLVGLTLAACGDDPTGPTAGVAVIRSTTSFGMCLGYCRSALEITADRTVYRLSDDRTQLPPLELTTATGTSEWQALSSAVNREELERLPGVIGCPDCADGGAESLEVVATTWSDSVAFEYRAQMPQLQPLLDQVRAIRDRHDRELRPR
jgi:hypothetical protein